MTDSPTLDDPMTFSVWANVDQSGLRNAAEHLATVVPMTVAQLYQLAKQAEQENRKVQIWSNCGLGQVTSLANKLPSGFILGSSVIAEDVANPDTSPFCRIHSCYYGRHCSICERDYLES
jgi:hypothetical protein